VTVLRVKLMNLFVPPPETRITGPSALASLLSVKLSRDVAGVYLAFANSDINVNGLVTNPAATGYVQTRTGTVGLNGY
jgi:hypothetical protein